MRPEQITAVYSGGRRVK